MVVGDILTLEYGRFLPRKNRREGTIPVYGSGGIIGSHDTALVHQPTVIVGRQGTPGSVFLSDGPCFPINTTFYVPPSETDPECLYWILACLPLPDLSAQAAVPGISRRAIYEQPVPDHYPPPPNLIATLSLIRRRRRIATLAEQRLARMAELLAKRWWAKGK